MNNSCLVTIQKRTYLPNLNFMYRTGSTVVRCYTEGYFEYRFISSILGPIRLHVPDEDIRIARRNFRPSGSSIHLWVW